MARKKRSGRDKKAAKSLQARGEIWILPTISSELLMPEGTPKSSERPIIVLEESSRLVNPSIARVLIAPLSTSAYLDPLDYVIIPGQHDHCNLIQESAVVVSCIQPVAKADFEGGISKGRISEEGLEAIMENLFELFGVDLELYD